MTADEIAMQTRCPNCLTEQWVLGVIAFSHGEAPCAHCRQKTRPMSHGEWVSALAATRRKERQVR